MKVAMRIAVQQSPDLLTADQDTAAWQTVIFGASAALMPELDTEWAAVLHDAPWLLSQNPDVQDLLTDVLDKHLCAVGQAEAERLCGERSDHADSRR